MVVESRDLSQDIRLVDRIHYVAVPEAHPQLPEFGKAGPGEFQWSRKRPVSLLHLMSIGPREGAIQSRYPLYIVVLAEDEADQGYPWVLSQDAQRRECIHRPPEHVVLGGDGGPGAVVVEVEIEVAVQERIGPEVVNAAYPVHLLVQRRRKAVAFIDPAEALSTCEYLPEFFHARYIPFILKEESTSPGNGPTNPLPLPSHMNPGACRPR